MNTYLLVKTLHIISATLLVGTGFGTAFYMFWVNRSGSVAAQSVVARWVVRADWWFTGRLRHVDDLAGGLAMVGEVDLDDARPLRLRRCLLVAGGVAATANGENRR